MYKIIGLFALIGFCAALNKVPVTVYYEALCPDSQAFINQQIYPSLKNGLNDYINIEWVPYGKSTRQTIGSNVNFECHHGPNECYGNKVHSCAIQHIQANSYENTHTRESLTLDFINCLMKAGKNFPDSKYPGERCARENHINNWENILTCANSTDGSVLLAKNGEKTDNFQNPLLSVPSVVFQYQFDKNTQDKALNNFAQVLCGKLLPKPQVCEAHSGAENVLIVPALTLVAFILSKLF